MDRFSIIAALARQVIIEAVKNRLLVIMPAVLLGVIGAGEFVGALAVTETLQVKGGTAAFIMRLAAAFIISLYVTTGVIREFQEKSIELVLALPVPRYVYYAGKLYGCLMLAAVMAGFSGLPLLLYAGPDRVWLWSFSLFCELSIITALCLFFLFTLRQVTATLSAVAAFYLLSRSMAGLQLINHGPLLESHAPGRELAGTLLDLMALLLPDFAGYTRTGWLVYGGGTVQDLWPIAVQTLVYTGLLSAAALFDLYRRNF